ncbi:MAG: class I SAM-dependent methyltransferase [Phycisphaerae bacterium]
MQATIETVRGFWDRRPCNIRHSPEPVGTRSYFDQVERRKYFVEPHIPGFADFARWRGKKVLEVGCGIGTDTVNFCRAGAAVTAVDLSGESLSITARRLEVYGLRAELHQANAEELTCIQDDQYDLVYSFGVLHHTPNPAAAVAQCRRVLKPGGELRVMLYNSASYKVVWAWLKYVGRGRGWDWRKAIQYYAEAQTGCPVAQSYTDRQARDLLRHFEVISIANDHIFPYVIRDYVRYRYRKAWCFRILPASVLRRLERRFGWHKLIIARKPACSLQRENCARAYESSPPSACGPRATHVQALQSVARKRVKSKCEARTA